MAEAGADARRRERGVATGWTADPAAESRLRLATEALAGFLYDWDLVAGRVERIGGLEALVGVHPDEVSPEADWWSARIHPVGLGFRAR